MQRNLKTNMDFKALHHEIRFYTGECECPECSTRRRYQVERERRRKYVDSLYWGGKDRDSLPISYEVDFYANGFRTIEISCDHIFRHCTTIEDRHERVTEQIMTMLNNMGVRDINGNAWRMPRSIMRPTVDEITLITFRKITV